MRPKLLLPSVLACALGAAATASLLAPEARAESALRWILGVAPDDGPRNPSGRIEIDTPRGKQVYWFVVVKVKNTHDEAVPLHLHFSATTDATEGAKSEGYHPHALAWLRQKYGDDLLDMVSLEGHVLEPGATARAAVVFQFRRADDPTRFEERMDELDVTVTGYADPVKRDGEEFTLEKRELILHFEKPGDEFDPAREQVKYRGSEEKISS
jgi:hypothetical protein